MTNLDWGAFAMPFPTSCFLESLLYIIEQILCHTPFSFLEAEKGTYKSANEVRAKVLNQEIKLTRQLLRGTEPANNWGITGSSVIDAAEAENSKYVKYDPVYIYYGALVSYGMILTNSNIYSLIYEKARPSTNNPRNTFPKMKKRNGRC